MGNCGGNGSGVGAGAGVSTATVVDSTTTGAGAGAGATASTGAAATSFDTGIRTDDVPWLLEEVNATSPPDEVFFVRCELVRFTFGQLADFAIRVLSVMLVSDAVLLVFRDGADGQAELLLATCRVSFTG